MLSSLPHLNLLRSISRTHLPLSLFSVLRPAFLSSEALLKRSAPQAKRSFRTEGPLHQLPPSHRCLFSSPALLEAVRPLLKRSVLLFSLSANRTSVLYLNPQRSSLSPVFFSPSHLPSFLHFRIPTSHHFLPRILSSIIWLSEVESVQAPPRHTWAVALPSMTCKPSVYPANLASLSAF